MGIRIIGDTHNIGVRLQPSRIVVSGDERKPAPGGDPDGSEHSVDGSDNRDEPISSVAAGFVDTATLGANSNSGSPGDAPFGYTKSGRRRNRPVGGTRSANSSRDSTQATDDIAKYLASGHLLVSKLLHMPQFMLSTEEAETLAAATTRVTQLYDMGIGTEEQRAWINLAMVAGAIYIPKVFSGKAEPIRVVNRPHPVQPVSADVPAWMNGQVQ
jgi:hypothetical protein